MSASSNSHFAHEFYKQYAEKLHVLDRLALDQFYLQAFTGLSDLPDPDPDTRQRLQSAFYAYVHTKRTELPNRPADQLLGAYRTNLDCCERLLVRDRDRFLADVAALIDRSYHLRTIVKAVPKVDAIVEQYAEQLANIENLRQSLGPTEIQSHLRAHYDRLLDLVDRHFPGVRTMSEHEDGLSVNSEGFQAILDEAVGKKKRTMSVASEEIHKMNREMFDSDCSLTTRNRMGKQNIEDKVKTVKTQMKTINELEMNIEEMQNQMKKISDATIKAKEKLEQKKQEMSDVLEDLVRLNRLLELINKDILKQITEFRDQIDAFELERERILNDPTLTEEQRKGMLDELNKQISVLKGKQAAALKQLNMRKSDLNIEIQSKVNTQLEELLKSRIGKSPSEIARIDAQIKAFQLASGLTAGQLQAEQTRLQIDELLQSKVGKTPSECERIDEQIRALQAKLQSANAYNEAEKLRQQIEDLQRAKLGKTPSECERIDEQIRALHDKLQAVTANAAYDECDLLKDEIGAYYLDENGAKVYVHNFLVDTDGRRYYVLADGTKVYPPSAYFISTGGGLRADASCESVSAVSQFEYAKQHMGRALRLALAETILYQPKDPINFVANHLLKQRHTELRKTVHLIREEATQLARARERARVRLEMEPPPDGVDPCDPCMPYK